MVLLRQIAKAKARQRACEGKLVIPVITKDKKIFPADITFFDWVDREEEYYLECNNYSNNFVVRSAFSILHRLSRISW